MMLRVSLRRLLRIISVIIRHMLRHSAGIVFSRWQKAADWLGLKSLNGPQRLRVIFEDVGGTFLKFGQMLALQPDILSLKYCNELFNLLDRVPPFSYAEIERIFVEELNQKPDEIFDYFEPKPLATASIGQVHVAYLNNRKLAIKVQRPEVEVDFEGDIRLMNATMSLIKTLRLRVFYWLIEPISEFVAWTSEELDYTCEARYMQQQRRNTANNGHERIPEVFGQYTTRRILVTEYLEGVTLLSYLRSLDSRDESLARRLKDMDFNPHLISRHIIDNFLGDVFQHGTFHADLHPANLMILPGNVVGYIDFGITGTISRYSRQNLIALTLAYTRGDLQGMCEAFFKISVTENEDSAERFRAGLENLSQSWYETENRERKLRKNFTLVMLDMLRLSRVTGVYPERDVIKYIRSAIAIDGLITRFAPDFDLGRHLQEVCSAHLRWNVRSSLLSYSALLDWAIANGRLAREGPFKFMEFGRRLMERKEEQDDRPTPASAASESLQRGIMQLGAALLFVSLLMTLTEEKGVGGFNLFTAGLLFIGAATLRLMRMIRKLGESY